MNAKSTLSVSVTKDVAKTQTRQQRLKRYHKLIAQDSDLNLIQDTPKSISKINSNSVVTEQLMENKEQVSPNDFEFIKVIGRRSYSKVFLVRKKDTGQQYAMKILKKKKIEKQDRVDVVKKERKMLAELKHPFLMKMR